VDGDCAFVADGTSGIGIIDVKDWNDPTLVSYGGSGGHGLIVTGDCAFTLLESEVMVNEVFQRRLDLGCNIAQSLPIDDGDEDIIRARIETAQSDSVRWYLSADDGVNWSEVEPGGDWFDLTAHPGSDLRWRAELLYAGGRVNPGCTDITVEWETESTAVNQPDVPARFALYQNSPNPFNPATEIRFDVPAPGGHVRLVVFDVSGRLIHTLVDGYEAPGTKRALWDGRDRTGSSVASGVYYYRLLAPGFDGAHRMALLK
jgi:hypothetical protein